MTVQLVTVDPGNWRTGLSIREDQQGHVAPASGILARAWAYRDFGSRMYIIQQDDTPVGMALYHDWPEDESYVLSQFFIDGRYQGRGLGYAAMEQILADMRQDGRYQKVCLCITEGNDAAQRLYEKCGFVRCPEEDDEDELIMRMKLKSA